MKKKIHEAGTILHAWGLYPFSVEAVEESRESPGTFCYRTTMGRGGHMMIHESQATTYRIPHVHADRVLTILRERSAGVSGMEMPETYDEAIETFGLEE